MRIVAETAVQPSFRALGSGNWYPAYKLRSTLVMPDADAALARLRADDRIWNDSSDVISTEETDLPQSPPGELGIEYIEIGR